MNMYVHYFKKNDIIHNNLISTLKSNDIPINDVIYKYCLNLGMEIFIENHLSIDFTDAYDEI
jgi:hypothetical protein